MIVKSNLDDRLDRTRRNNVDKPGGSDWVSLSAFSVSVTHKVYRYFEQRILNLTTLAVFLIFTERASFRRAFWRKSRMSVICFGYRDHHDTTRSKLSVSRSSFIFGFGAYANAAVLTNSHAHADVRTRALARHTDHSATYHFAFGLLNLTNSSKRLRAICNNWLVELARGCCLRRHSEWLPIVFTHENLVITRNTIKGVGERHIMRWDWSKYKIV